MCAVIGVCGDIDERAIFNIKRIFEESQIRGKHATGVSWVCENGLHSISEPVPATSFISVLDLISATEIVKAVIGHTRYSTSNLRYNQPIVSEGVHLVHNGVVTQSDKSEWEELFGVICETSNDSEIILRRFLSNRLISLIEGSGSYSLIMLLKTGEILFFRNAYRPLWYYIGDNNVLYISSTTSILSRVFGVREFLKCESGTVYYFNPDKAGEGVKTALIGNCSHDLQVKPSISDYYGLPSKRY